MASIVLENNKIGYHRATNTAKIGNGTATWDELEPFNKITVVDDYSSNNPEYALSANKGSELKAYADSIKNSVDLLTDKDLDNRLTTAEANIINNQNSISSIQASITDSIGERLGSAESSISALQSSTETNAGNITTMNTAIVGINGRVSNLETQFAAWKTAYPRVLAFISED